MLTRVTSTLVLAVLIGTAGVRLGCAWSCLPLPATAAAAHCHETSLAALEFSAPATCNDVRPGSALLEAAVRPDATMFAIVDRVTSLSLATDAGAPLRPSAARPSPASSPPAFQTPLRQ